MSSTVQGNGWPQSTWLQEVRRATATTSGYVINCPRKWMASINLASGGAPCYCHHFGLCHQLSKEMDGLNQPGFRRCAVLLPPLRAMSSTVQGNGWPQSTWLQEVRR